MRAFRPMYRDRKGQYKKIKRYWIVLRDHTRTIRQFPAFTNKAASENLGRQVEKLVAAKISCGSLDPQLARWLREIPEDLRERFVKFGLISQKEAAAGRLLSEHIAKWVKKLEDKSRTSKHIRQARNDVTQIFKGCRWRYYRDIDAVQLESYLLDLHDRGRGISARTYNSKLKFCKQFCNWMVMNGLASESPLKVLSGLDVEKDRRRVRRALEG